MHVHRYGSDVVVQAPAKLNLFFEILARRIDGFHEIETLVYPINLYDTLYFREHSGGQVELGLESVSGVWESDDSGSLAAPADTDNLVVRAVELLRRRAGISRGASLRLVKRIPSAAGLGGGSSDAAAALVAGNVGWNLGWSRSKLGHLAAELGSDVPLFLFDGPSFCRGRGELVEPVSGLGLLHFVVVHPPVGLSTAKVYGVCKVARRARCVTPLLDALGRGDLGTAGRSLFNRLELAAETLSPWIGQLRREFSRMDCLGYQVSGSGSCYFGLCRHARHARRVARRLQACGVGTAYAVRGSR